MSSPKQKSKAKVLAELRALRVRLEYLTHSDAERAVVEQRIAHRVAALNLLRLS